MKRFIILLSVLILMLFLPIAALAHPGRTDSNGGHIDHSTGEYHYHHGHPAHDHYDMDEDGIIDCPYAFDDQTGKNSGESAVSSSSYVPSKNNNYTNPINSVKESDPAQPVQEEISYGKIFLHIFAIVAIALPIMLILFFSIEWTKKVVLLQEHTERQSVFLAIICSFFAIVASFSFFVYFDTFNLSWDQWLGYLYFLIVFTAVCLIFRIIKTVRSISGLRKQLSEYEWQYKLAKKQVDHLETENAQYIHKLEDLMSQELLPITEVNKKIASLNSDIDSLRNLYNLNCKELDQVRKNLFESNGTIFTLQAENRMLRESNDNLSHTVNVINTSLSFHKARESIADALGIPSDVYFTNRGCSPVRGSITYRKPFGDFTVYVAEKGRCYHSNCNCGSGYLRSRHAYDVISKLPPCKKCGIIYEESVPEWYLILRRLVPYARSNPLALPAPVSDSEQLNIPNFTDP